MLPPERPDDILLRYFDRRLLEYGDTPQGAYWPNEKDRRTRFDVMLDIIPFRLASVTLCDLGCGTGELLAHIRRRRLNNIIYIGVDRSQIALSYARSKFPGTPFIKMNVTGPEAKLDQLACDYLIADGLFTAKFELTHEQMWSLLVTTIERVWPYVRRGLAFNVMSKVVDWERDDLFHLPMDDAARLLHRLAGRCVQFRADYGLYEYTAYAYKQEKARPPAAKPAAFPREAAEDVPVLRPHLPSTDRLMPYLRRIDATRVYANHGPLVVHLERRLARALALRGGGVACASSGTAALIGAILATAGRVTKDRPLALIPAFTFVATALAVELCGFHPYLADIDTDSWMLDPAQLSAHPLLNKIGVVIPVAPFGRPVPQEPWLEFRERTGIPIVIDGAASFDRLISAPHGLVGSIPIAMSFHATKAFATGEGGAVASTDASLVVRVVRALNFGFDIARDSRAPSTNGKMSEYHAAVGLAALNGWARKHDAILAVTDCYRRRLMEEGLADRCFGPPNIGMSYSLFRCHGAVESRSVQKRLHQSGVGWRLWYGTGLHHQTYYSHLPHESLPVTDAIAPCLLGLPTAPDLTDGQVARVVAALAEGLADA